MFKKQAEAIESTSRNIAVSLNVGVIIAGVALLVATVALVVAVRK
jgi:hypothetical protein